MTASCQDHRDELRLLSLRKRLVEDALTPEEREEIETLVEELERRLRI
jgi:hypothetical protein